jgi:putative transposase
MAKGFMYLTVIMDWYSRRVLAWRVSNTLETDACVEALEEALLRYGAPEIFNTDQVLKTPVRRSRRYSKGMG